MTNLVNGPPAKYEKRSASVGTEAERDFESKCSTISIELAAKIKRLDAEVSPAGIVEIALAEGRWDRRKSKARCFLAGSIVVNSYNDRWVNLTNGHFGSGTTSLIAEAYGLDLEAAAATVEALLHTLTNEDGEQDWPSFLNEAA